MEAENNPKHTNFFVDIVRFTILAAIIVIPFRLFVAQPFVVNGASMDPTFETGEYLIVDQVTYAFSQPERDSVIIFKYPKDETKYFIKRVIGLPGETIEIHGTTVTVKNKEFPDGFTLPEPYISENNAKREDVEAVVLGKDEFFVMGDNRAGSSDSRAWGPVKSDLIVGRPFVRLLPVTRLEFFPGAVQAVN